MRKKVDQKRIERLEAFARRLKIEDAKRRHLESFSKMSDEEAASVYFAIKQIQEAEEEDPWKAEELFRSGLAATERLEERGRLGWRRYCETGGQAAVADFCEVTDDERSSSAGSPGDQRDLGVLFEGVNTESSRVAGIRLHVVRLASESEKRELCEEFPSLKKWVDNDAQS